MKQLLSFVLAGAIGGIITLAGVRITEQPQASLPSPESLGRQVSFWNASPGASAPVDFKLAARKAMPAVVHIEATESKQTAINRGRQNDPFSFFFGENFFGTPLDELYMPRQGAGSGVIYTSDGYIVTNNHVIEFADEIQVTLYDNRKFKAEVVGTYPKTDLAVLKIEAAGLPTLEVADSDAAEIGEWVLAVGNPLNLTSTVTAGIISAKGRDIDIIQGNDAIESFIQTDAAVNPGNSGGALVDAEGRWLGINTAISTRTGYFQGYSFAIPVNIAVKIVDDIIEYGSFQRAYLGVGISELDAEEATAAGLNAPQGVVIETIEDGGSAQYAGILPKDIVVAVDDRPVRSIPELQEIIGRSRVGDTILLTVVRNGEKLELPVKLKAR